MEASAEGLAVQVRLSASVSPSEDPEKVLDAMRKVLGDCDYSTASGRERMELASGSIACLHRLHDQLRDRHVRDAARRLLLRSLEGRRLTLLLHRQAATVGIIAVCSSEEESALGPLVLEVETEEPQRLIDWLTAY